MKTDMDNRLSSMGWMDGVYRNRLRHWMICWISRLHRDRDLNAGSAEVDGGGGGGGGPPRSAGMQWPSVKLAVDGVRRWIDCHTEQQISNPYHPSLQWNYVLICHPQKSRDGYG